MPALWSEFRWGMFAKAAVVMMALASKELVHGATLDVKSTDAVNAAYKAAMPWLGYYWAPAGDGAWDQKVIQWHESGEFWNCYLDYRLTTGDSTYDRFVAENMQLASFGEAGSFLGPNRLIQETLFGKWNDDIAWWALAAVTGAEIYGTDSRITPSDSATWYTVASNTLTEMFEQYDESAEEASTDQGLKAYKSVISNVQAIQLAARLHHLQPSNSTYRVLADRVVTWLQTADLLRKDSTISDGVTALNASTCGEAFIDRNLWSYQPGVILSEQPPYTSILPDIYPSRIINEVWEPLCEADGFPCKKTPGGYSWSVFRAFSHMCRLLPLPSRVRSRIETIVETSATAMASRCKDDWNCVRDISPVPREYTFPNGTNPRDQIEAVGILDALAAVRGVWTVRFRGADSGGISSTGVVVTTTTTEVEVGRQRVGRGGPWRVFWE
ncbi:glycosyl hydrolase family 76-domain-containing protein [Chytridium lagenaria]|nr:glycosyl hydrolase family 76-domain-containing protein [Chytridium lagenaria]